MMPAIELYTIGHSNHSLDVFVELLQRNGVRALVDVRRFPGSRTVPQFNREELSAFLASAEIDYFWIEALGGRRPKRKGFHSPNEGLRNDSFRNYADHMLTDEFQRGIEELAAIAAGKRTAIMCAENVFWRCHRRLVSDYVVARGGAVQHIFPGGECKPHVLTSQAKFLDGELTYPGPKTLFD